MPLDILCNCTARYVSDLVGNPKDQFSHNEAHLAYEGHSRINDNEFITRKVLLYSVLFIMPHGDTDITYSCLKFGAFIMARINAMII